MFLSEPFKNLADANHDERVTAAEMRALAEKWWAEWDASGAGKVASATGITDLVVGVLLNTPNSGEVAIVAVDGVAPCAVSASGITAAARVTSTTGGAAIDCTTADSHVGTALQTGTSGQTKMIKIHIGNTLA
jgi:hypothetical protein